MSEGTLTAFSAALLTALWRATWQGALAIGVLYALCRLLEARYPPSANLRCWLWRAGYLKMLLALTSLTGITLAVLPTTVGAPAVRASSLPAHAPAISAVRMPAETPVSAAVPPTHGMEVTEQAVIAAFSSWQAWVAALYLLGVAICLSRVTQAGLRTRRVLREATVCEDGALNDEANRLARLLGLRRVPPLAYSPHITSPCCAAGAVLLPTGKTGAADLAGFAPEERRLILAHELAHVRRRDLVWEWLATLTQVVFFFHPLIYLARREERLSRESAADTDALSVTASLASAYAALLVGISHTPAARRPQGGFFARPADDENALAGVVGVLERGVLLRRRLLYLKENNMISPASHRRALSVAVPALLVSAAVLLPWRVTAIATAKIPLQASQEPNVTETIRLNYIDAKSIPAVIKDTQGIDRLTCDFKDNSVTIRGDQKAVDTFKIKIKQMDIESPIYVTPFRLVRYHVDARGKYTESALEMPILSALEGTLATFTVQGAKDEHSGYTINVTISRGVSKSTVQASVEVQLLGEQGEVVSSGKNTRSLILGRSTRITGMTTATDKALRRAVQNGQIVTNKGEYAGYYVEIKPTVQSRYGGSTP